MAIANHTRDMQNIVPEAANALLQCSPDCVKVLDPEGRVAFFNDAGLCVMEIDDFAAVQGKYWPLLWPEDNRHLAEGALADARATGSGSFQGECPTAKGTLKWWDVVVNTVPEQVNIFGGFIVTSRDITRQHELELAQQRHDARLREILGATSDVLWDINLETDKVWWGEGMQSLFGYKPEQVGDDIRWCHEHIHPEDRQRVINSMMDAVQNGDVAWHSEFRFRRADGTYVDVLDRGSILRDPSGKALRFVGVLQDISVQKAREERQDLVVRELAHRSNNVLAVVLGILHQTRARSTDLDSFAKALASRIIAMSNANSAVIKGKWAGADLEELAMMQFEPFVDGKRIHVAGPKVLLTLDVAQPIALALNELATNAIKHGALSTTTGSVEFKWKVEPRAGEDHLVMEWREHGGPPVQQPTRVGLGSKLIDRGIPGAKVQRRFETSGFRCLIELPAGKMVTAKAVG